LNSVLVSTIASETNFFGAGWGQFVSGDGAITNNGDGSFTAAAVSSGRAFRTFSASVVAGRSYDLSVDIAACSGDVTIPATVTSGITSKDPITVVPSALGYFSRPGTWTLNFFATATGSATMWVGVGTSGTQGAGSARITAMRLLDVTYGRNGQDTGVAIGDSITFTGHYAYQMMQQRETLDITLKGIGGQTLTQIEARFATDVVALAPRFCVIEGGINDIQLTGVGVDPTSTMQTKVISMIGQARAASIVPIVVNVTPFKNSTNWTAERQGYLDAYNAWLLSYTTTNSVLMLDANALLVDPATPQTLLAAFDSGDHLHWGTLGHRIVGNALMSRI
jgi:lysophospholipase L1-like esterase